MSTQKSDEEINIHEYVSNILHEIIRNISDRTDSSLFKSEKKLCKSSTDIVTAEISVNEKKTNKGNLGDSTNEIDAIMQGENISVSHETICTFYTENFNDVLGSDKDTGAGTNITNIPTDINDHSENSLLDKSQNETKEISEYDSIFQMLLDHLDKVLETKSKDSISNDNSNISKTDEKSQTSSICLNDRSCQKRKDANVLRTAEISQMSQNDTANAMIPIPSNVTDQYELFREIDNVIASVDTDTFNSDFTLPMNDSVVGPFSGHIELSEANKLNLQNVNKSTEENIENECSTTKLSEREIPEKTGMTDLYTTADNNSQFDIDTEEKLHEDAIEDLKQNETEISVETIICSTVNNVEGATVLGTVEIQSEGECNDLRDETLDVQCDDLSQTNYKTLQEADIEECTDKNRTDLDVNNSGVHNTHILLLDTLKNNESSGPIESNQMEISRNLATIDTDMPDYGEPKSNYSVKMTDNENDAEKDCSFVSHPSKDNNSSTERSELHQSKNVITLKDNMTATPEKCSSKQTNNSNSDNLDHTSTSELSKECSTELNKESVGGIDENNSNESLSETCTEFKKDENRLNKCKEVIKHEPVEPRKTQKTSTYIIHKSLLEDFFQEKQCPTVADYKNLAKRVGLPLLDIKQWFYNKRAENAALKSCLKDQSKRMRKTSLKKSVLQKLEKFYVKNSHPTDEEISNLAKQLSLPKERVCTWISNKWELADDEFKQSSPARNVCKSENDEETKGKHLSNLDRHTKIVLKRYFGRIPFPTSNFMHFIAEKLNLKYQDVRVWFELNQTKQSRRKGHCKIKNKHFTPNKTSISAASQAHDQLFKLKPVLVLNDIKKDGHHTIVENSSSPGKKTVTLSFKEGENKFDSLKSTSQRSKPCKSFILNERKSKFQNAKEENKNVEADNHVLMKFYKKNKDPDSDSIRDISKQTRMKFNAVRVWFYWKRKKDGLKNTKQLKQKKYNTKNKSKLSGSQSKSSLQPLKSYNPSTRHSLRWRKSYNNRLQRSELTKETNVKTRNFRTQIYQYNALKNKKNKLKAGKFKTKQCVVSLQRVPVTVKSVKLKNELSKDLKSTVASAVKLKPCTVKLSSLKCSDVDMKERKPNKDNFKDCTIKPCSVKLRPISKMTPQTIKPCVVNLHQLCLNNTQKLKRYFNSRRYPTELEIELLSENLNMNKSSVELWFENERKLCDKATSKSGHSFSYTKSVEFNDNGGSGTKYVQSKQCNASKENKTSNGNLNKSNAKKISEKVYCSATRVKRQEICKTRTRSTDESERDKYILTRTRSSCLMKENISIATRSRSSSLDLSVGKNVSRRSSRYCSGASNILPKEIISKKSPGCLNKNTTNRSSPLSVSRRTCESKRANPGLSQKVTRKRTSNILSKNKYIVTRSRSSRRNSSVRSVMTRRKFHDAGKLSVKRAGKSNLTRSFVRRKGSAKSNQTRFPISQKSLCKTEGIELVVSSKAAVESHGTSAELGRIYTKNINSYEENTSNSSFNKSKRKLLKRKTASSNGSCQTKAKQRKAVEELSQSSDESYVTLSPSIPETKVIELDDFSSFIIKEPVENEKHKNKKQGHQNLGLEFTVTREEGIISTNNGAGTSQSNDDNIGMKLMMNQPSSPTICQVYGTPNRRLSQDDSRFVPTSATSSPVIVISPEKSENSCVVNQLSSKHLQKLADLYRGNKNPSLHETEMIAKLLDVDLLDIVKWYETRRKNDIARTSSHLMAPFTQSHPNTNNQGMLSTGQVTDNAINLFHINVTSNNNNNILNLNGQNGTRSLPEQPNAPMSMPVQVPNPLFNNGQPYFPYPQFQGLNMIEGQLSNSVTRNNNTRFVVDESEYKN